MSDSVVKQRETKEYDLNSSEKASFLSSATGAAENTYMTQKQKSQRTKQTNINKILKKHSQAERQNQKRPLARDDNR